MTRNNQCTHVLKHGRSETQGRGEGVDFGKEQGSLFFRNQREGVGKYDYAKINSEEKRRKLDKLGPYGLRCLGHLLREWRHLERRGTRSRQS